MKYFEDANEKHKETYNTYGAERYVEGYWDTKANDLYYS